MQAHPQRTAPARPHSRREVSAFLARKRGCRYPPAAVGDPWITAPRPCLLRAGRFPIFRAPRIRPGRYAGAPAKNGPGAAAFEAGGVRVLGEEKGMPLSTGRRWRPVDNGTAPLPLAGRALPL